MTNKIDAIRTAEAPLSLLADLIGKLHESGPNSADLLETLALFKRFHPSVFTQVEERILSAMGLFYKIKDAGNLYSLIMSTVGEYYAKVYGKALTPVQANVRNAIDSNQFVSISAPTSAGKSFSIRDFILAGSGDAVVVVPSRALIAEYVSALRQATGGAKNIMISPFVDNVFKSRRLKHIFVLTPERARELFLPTSQSQVSTFFFDEAQISEEKNRGVIFDVMVRRVRKKYPSAKIIFAHPFVDNPVAQFRKHDLNEADGYACSFSYGTVGKISIHRHSNGNDYYFSPHQLDGHLLKHCVKFEGKFEDYAFTGDHSVLIFVSKASIYNGEFLEPFAGYIAQFPEVIASDAWEIIKAVEIALGANDEEHPSKLVKLLRKGVVIHHGSVPLDVRFLIEDFIRKGFAKICFATNTLAQGVNMPFDIVWLHSMRFQGDEATDKSLSFKNLTGRAGRLSPRKQFDFGYVFTNNAALYCNRVNDSYTLNEKSVLDMEYDNESEDIKELIDSIRADTFDDEANMPAEKLARLKSDEIYSACLSIINIIFARRTIRLSIEGESNRPGRDIIRSDLRLIYEIALRRELYDGEESVFNEAVKILRWSISGRTFKEIAGIRYSKISKRDLGHQGVAGFSQPASNLPDVSLKNRFPLFGNIPARDVSYDAVVFDTYDYTDKVISFSLMDTFIAAFREYGSASGDQRATRMMNLLRYGSDNEIHILLMRYGFPPESVLEISEYVESIDEDSIVLSADLSNLQPSIREMLEWYLP